MFNRKDRVVRKDISRGVRQGTVVEQIEDRVKVVWDSGKITTLPARRILLATPENVTAVSLKRM
jgi:hypothetical protein